VVGGIIGHATGSTARGAIIGAAVGGTAGALIGRRMDKRAEELARQLPDAKVSRVGEGIAVTFENGILFPFDSSELLPDARTNLRRLADQLQDEARTDVMIVGHTDSQGTDEYNQRLSERRARAAAEYLADQGVSSARLRSTGRGEREPIESNATESGRQQNRRVEVAIYANRAWREDARREAGGD
jgi:outer membrane protein OmpA-like peptidoglycan-associated protein